jgi:hypothetical protein
MHFEEHLLCAWMDENVEPVESFTSSAQPNKSSQWKVLLKWLYLWSVQPMPHSIQDIILKRNWCTTCTQSIHYIQFITSITFQVVLKYTLDHWPYAASTHTTLFRTYFIPPFISNSNFIIFHYIIILLFYTLYNPFIILFHNLNNLSLICKTGLNSRE